MSKFCQCGNDETSNPKCKQCQLISEIKQLKAGCNPRLIRCTDLAWAIADELQVEHNCDSISELIEWVLLSQRYPVDQAAAIFARRKKRGGLGGIYVLPDEAQLPPEG